MSQEEINKQHRNKKIIRLLWIGTGAAVLGTAGYLGWQYHKNNKPDNSDSKQEDTSTDTTTYVDKKTSSYSPPPPPVPKANDDFTIKKGSKGAKVKQLQDALIAKYGKAVLPKYGADSDFGNEVISALTSKGFPSEIDESTFNVLTEGTKTDFSKLADVLYMAASSKDLNAMISALKLMKSVDDYKAVGDIFKTKALRGVRQTLVNGTLSSFTESDKKEKIKMEFLRMGLKYSGDKWALSGIQFKQIITKVPTRVWANSEESVSVPAGIVLGRELITRNGYTAFETINNKKLIVKSDTVTLFKQ